MGVRDLAHTSEAAKAAPSQKRYQIAIAKWATRRRMIVLTRLRADKVLFPLISNNFSLLTESYAPWLRRFTADMSRA